LEQGVIRLRGVRQHNLKNLDLDIPLNKLIALTGVSGSGKSSLALHTLYAEGQRRYIETFSPYARQFLERMDPPEADLIEGIPPSIAIESGTVVRSSRSTVGTITEINDYLKLLFARLAVPYCPTCGNPVAKDTPETIYAKLGGLSPEDRVLVCFPFQAGLDGRWRTQLVSQGFLRVFAGGAVVDIDSLGGADSAGFAGLELLVIVDRLLWGKAGRSRVLDSITTAYRMGGGRLAVVVMPDHITRFSSELACANCAGASPIAPPNPNLFSFNSPIGACPKCRGFGRTIGVDIDLVIPDRGLTIGNGAVKPFGTDREEYFELIDFCMKEKIPVDVPFGDLDESARRKIINGTKGYYGIKGFFKWLETKTYKMHVRVYLSRYRAYVACDACGGSRLQPAALLYRLRGRSIAELASCSIENLSEFLGGEWPEISRDPAASLLMAEVRSRIQFLMAVGLYYLSLDRQSRTLSGGEVQRVHLTRALGSALVNVLYVLDEPSVGLHARDQKRLMGQLNRLVGMGNSVVMVEHDPGMIRFCDEVIDMGPGGGERGGKVVFKGPPGELARSASSLTGAYLCGRKSVLPHSMTRRSPHPWKKLSVTGARENNLKGIDVTIPLGLLVGVSGVSGSGKSTLVEKTLYQGWLRKKGRPAEPPGLHDEIKGAQSVREIMLVDQRPVGRTPRANLLTYTGALDPLRMMLAATPEAIARGFSTRHFSFNVPGGRCETCSGEGFERVEMQFLADVFIRCPQCGGKRYKQEVLDIKLRGVSIGDMLEMSAREVLERFPENGQLAGALEPVIAIGLDYIRLGQPLSTLSGGEAQRLKLIRHLSDGQSGPVLFILDEPTTGLHPDDISKLIRVLHKLVEKGNTVLVVEHNLDLLAACDWIIDLGPEGGERGGRIVCEGTPEMVSGCAQSITGLYLGERLDGAAVRTGAPLAEAAEPQAAFLGKMKQEAGTTDADTRRHPEAGTKALSPSLPPSPRPPSPRRSLSRSPLPAPTPLPPEIVIRGAREHNLAIDEIRIPRRKMSVLTGISGSGKSTLAFDVLFAEGQRRYLECLSSYVRQYFRIMEKPEVDQITGLPPTIAIEQRTSQFGRRSTVGTITETYHLLRLLYAKLGVQRCPGCGRDLETLSVDDILSRILKETAGQSAGIARLQNRRAQKALPAPPQKAAGNMAGGPAACLLAPLVHGRKGIYRDLFARLSRMGFRQARVDGEYVGLARIPEIARHREHDIEVVMPGLDRVPVNTDALLDSVRRGLAMGGGMVYLDLGQGQTKVYSRHLYCPACDRGLAPLDPRLFSFNSRQGFCPSCTGIGRMDCNEDVPCPACGGSRLNPQARSVYFRGLTISDMSALSVSELRGMWKNFCFTKKEAPIARPIAREIEARLAFLGKVGLGYLSLDRSGDTLSGGETQRIRLAAQLGSNLRGVCYILDEPTIGLHPADNRKLLESLEDLRDKGNSVIIVEHDPETMKKADMLVELGPGAGSSGGKLVAAGSFDKLAKSPETLTGRWFEKSLDELWSIPARKKPGDLGWIEFKGLRARNLKGIDVMIPLGLLVTVTGVSGAGKSTLVNEIIYSRLCEALGGKTVAGSGTGYQVSDVRNPKIAEGSDTRHPIFVLHRVLEVDHNPIGRTPRSIPATYIGVWDEIRKLFAMLPESRARGFGPGRFSFNVKGGRCEQCKGQGQSKVEMNFLPDVFVPCESCAGTRFNAETLDIGYKGQNIADVLQMTVERAVELFSELPRISRQLKILSDLGLGYLELGQPSPTLSGGEAQRIKLAGELGNSRSATLYILDEPTTGLHRADIKRLVDVLRALTDHGHTVLVIEHNTDFIWASDYVIDLGPGSGDEGGEIVAQGTPEEIVAAAQKSLTGQALRPYAGKTVRN
jgi:excinuclease ABC subunit A